MSRFSSRPISRAGARAPPPSTGLGVADGCSVSNSSYELVGVVFIICVCLVSQGPPMPNSAYPGPAMHFKVSDFEIGAAGAP